MGRYFMGHDEFLVKIKVRRQFLLVISPDKSLRYTGFTSVALPLYILNCVRDNSKMLWHTHVFGSGEVPYGDPKS